MRGINCVSCVKFRDAWLIRRCLELGTKWHFFKVPTLGGRAFPREAKLKIVLVPFCSIFCALSNDIQHANVSTTAVTSFGAKLWQKREKPGNGGSLGGCISKTCMECENRLSQRDEELSCAYVGAIARKTKCRILLKVSHKWGTPKTLTPPPMRPLWQNVATFGISIAGVIPNVPTKFGRNRITPRGSKTPPKFSLWSDLDLERWPWPRRSRCRWIELVEFHRGVIFPSAVPRVQGVFPIPVTVAIFPSVGAKN